MIELFLTMYINQRVKRFFWSSLRVFIYYTYIDSKLNALLVFL